MDEANYNDVLEKKIDLTKQKKITILSLHLGVGGAEQSIASISNILSKNNKVEIISTYKLNDSPAFYIDPKVKIKYLTENLKPNKTEFKQALKSKKIISILKEGFKSIKILYLRKKLMVQAIKECDSDIIISTRVLHSKWLGKYGNKNSIKIAQEHNHHNGNKKIIKETINSLKNIDYFMPVSQELTDFYKELLKHTSVKCIYIPHSLDVYPSEPSNLESKRIVSVGRLSKEKGFDDLIDVFKLVHDIDKEIELDIIGDGTEKMHIEEKIKEFELSDKVILHGFKNKNELKNLYLNASLYVMTSFTESFGLVLIEAESYGLPLIAFDSAQGAKEIIKDGKNGYLVKNRSKEIMAKRIIDFMNNIELRKKFGNIGRECAKEYKEEVVTDIWNNFLNEI